MRTLLLLTVCSVAAALSAAETVRTAPSAPCVWTNIHAELIAQWKKDNRAPDGVAVDPAAHRIRFLAEATGVTKDDIAEFFLVGPNSDRAYESLAVTVPTPTALASALDRAGVPRGLPVSATEPRLWPYGERMTLSARSYGAEGLAGDVLAFSNLVVDVRAGEEGAVLARPFVSTRGTCDAQGIPSAESELPCAVFPLYNLPQALFLLDGVFDQSVTYGRFKPACAFATGALIEFIFAWDGRNTVRSRDFEVGATNNLAAAFRTLRASAADVDLHVRLALADDVTVARAGEVAGALALVDGKALKMNGCVPGEFYFRAFLPEDGWRDRRKRIFQPFEVHVKKDGAKTFAFIAEDWSGDGDEPKLDVRTRPFDDWKDIARFVSESGDEAAKIPVLFLYAPRTMRVGDLKPVLKSVPKHVTTFYVFAEEESK